MSLLQFLMETSGLDPSIPSPGSINSFSMYTSHTPSYGQAHEQARAADIKVASLSKPALLIDAILWMETENIQCPVTVRHCPMDRQGKCSICHYAIDYTNSR